MASEGRESVSLHPMVLVNVSDHMLRAKQETEGAPQRVFGLLFGSQSGLSVHIYDSFEAVCKVSPSGRLESLDKEHVAKKQAHISAVFPSYELLGWYSVGGKELGDEDMALHRAFQELNAAPLLLQVDSELQHSTTELPVRMFESVMQVVREQPQLVFVDVPFHIEATEPERIAVDHVVKTGAGSGSEGGAASSALRSHLGDLHNSVGMLTKRMRVLEAYLRATREGKVPRDHAVLREIAALCNSLPVVDSPEFEAGFAAELEDAKLIAYLATVVKGTGVLAEVQKKLAAAKEGGPMAKSARREGGAMGRARARLADGPGIHP
jgi:COP9 signalosome complex subunit 6